MSDFPSELTGTWDIDAAHSTVGFAVKHAVVATTRGHFTAYTGGATIDAANPENSTAWLEIDAASVTTGNADRDAHLKSPEFFNVEAHPKVTFKSTSAKADAASNSSTRTEGFSLSRYASAEPAEPAPTMM